MIERVERAEAQRLAAYRGTFAVTEPERNVGDEVPAGWEGVLFPFAVPVTDLRPDGTPARDGVIPEIDLPRRMYAGEDTTFHAPVRIGDEVTQRTTLGAVTEKNGASGRLVFVDVEREYTIGGDARVRSVWHDVFLEAADPDAPPREPRRARDAVAEADWVERMTLDARQLFRFSALTFNTHLIHYDRQWAQREEGLPDLLVHGPLTRILLMDAARRRRPEARARSLSVRMVAPSLVDREMRMAGRDDGDRTIVTALDPDDAVLATAEVGWA